MQSFMESFFLIVPVASFILLYQMCKFAICKFCTKLEVSCKLLHCLRGLLIRTCFRSGSRGSGARGGGEDEGAAGLHRRAARALGERLLRRAVLRDLLPDRQGTRHARGERGFARARVSRGWYGGRITRVASCAV